MAAVCVSNYRRPTPRSVSQSERRCGGFGSDWNGGRGKEGGEIASRRVSHISRGFYIASHKISRNGGRRGGRTEGGEGRKGSKASARAGEDDQRAQHRAVCLTTLEGDGPRQRPTAAEISFHNCVRWKHSAASVGLSPSLRPSAPPSSVRPACVRCPSAANKCCCHRHRRRPPVRPGAPASATPPSARQ